MHKRVLVTGAAGFIGYAIAERASRDENTQVWCVDNFVRGEDDPLYLELCARPNVTRLDIDLADPAQVTETLPAEVDYVYHMAALNGTQNFYERPFEVVRCSTVPTVLLLAKYGPTALKRFVYAGSSEAYASTVTRFGWEVPTAEDVPLGIEDPSNVRWSYGASKLHGEVATFAAGAQFDMPFTVIRYHNVYGPRMGDKHVVPDFLIRARNGEYVLFGHEDTRAFLYIDDAVTATMGCAEAESCQGEVVNVGSEREVVIRDLGEAMMRAIGVDQPITLNPSPKGSVKRRAPRIEKLHRLTGFREEWDLDRGLVATARFYMEDGQ